MFDSNNVSVTQYRAEKVVNVEDVTGTGFIYTEPELWKLISGTALTVIGIISELLIISLELGTLSQIPLFLLIPCILLLLSSLISRKSLFFIEYAGGTIKFDASIYGIEESQDFQKQIRRVQDFLRIKTNDILQQSWIKIK